VPDAACGSDAHPPPATPNGVEPEYSRSVAGDSGALQQVQLAEHTPAELDLVRGNAGGLRQDCLSKLSTHAPPTTTHPVRVAATA